MKEIVINELNQGQRADKFVRKYLNEAPLSFIYKLFRIKDVKINGKRIDASYILKSGDVMRIYVTDAQLAEFNKPKEVLPINTSLDIIYEDDNILIINNNYANTKANVDSNTINYQQVDIDLFDLNNEIGTESAINMYEKSLEAIKDLNKICNKIIIISIFYTYLMLS